MRKNLIFFKYGAEQKDWIQIDNTILMTFIVKVRPGQWSLCSFLLGNEHFVLHLLTVIACLTILLSIVEIEK